MIEFNLDDCLFYIESEEDDKLVSITKEKILTYMDYPISFHGDIGKSFTLRKFRAMLKNYPYLLLPYLSFQDFIRLTNNVGFKVINIDNDFEKIIIGKTFNITKSNLTLLSQEIIPEEENNILLLNNLKINKSYFVRKYNKQKNREIRIDCYAKGKIYGEDKYTSLSAEKIINIYDLPIEISNDRYVEYTGKENEEGDSIIGNDKKEDLYLGYDSITLKDMLDAIDMDIEFWDDDDINVLNEEIKKQEDVITRYKKLEDMNKE